MTYPRLERFHNTSADFDSADAAIAAGIGNGKAIAARLLALATEENAPCLSPACCGPRRRALAGSRMVVKQRSE